MKHRLPFAFYRLPVPPGRRKNKNTPMVVAQFSPAVLNPEPGQDISESKGFLFAPFHEYRQYKKVLIRPDIFTSIYELPDLNFAIASPASVSAPRSFEKKVAVSELQFSNYVRQIKLNIWRKKFRKVVAARSIEVKRPRHFHAADLFLSLCEEYPQAFVSAVYIPEYGCWIGASPELLLESVKACFHTHSVAGTKATSIYRIKKEWGDKEKEEQKLVSEYITDAYKKITGRTPAIAAHGTLSAGNVVHLRTDFELNPAPTASWQQLAEELHPTPAVAGLPKKEAIDFILKSETSDRAFYSGYLGPVNLDGSVHLYVNLRCMKVQPRNLVLFVGAGITLSSEVEREWKETKLKAYTLFNMLKDRYRTKELL